LSPHRFARRTTRPTCQSETPAALPLVTRPFAPAHDHGQQGSFDESNIPVSTTLYLPLLRRDTALPSWVRRNCCGAISLMAPEMHSRVMTTSYRFSAESVAIKLPARANSISIA